MAEKGSSDAQVAVGTVLTGGLGGIDVAEEEGINWLRTACEAGSAQGQFEYGKHVQL